MSSCGNPTTDQDALMPRRLRFNKGKTCIKCKANPGKIVIRHAVYCKECFIPLVTSKFRRSLEPTINADAGTSKRPRLKASGSLVLGFSGGLGSSILLDLVHKTYFINRSPVDDGLRGGTNHPRGANAWTSCAVCYVEASSAFPGTCDRTDEIEKALASYPNFAFIPLRLEFTFDDSWWRSVSTTDQDRSQLAVELGKDGLYTEALCYAPSRDFSPVDALRTYLGSLPTRTAISTAVRTLIRLLLLYTARSHLASHLLLGTSLTSLSISLISCISQGGGHSIPEEFQEEWRPASCENTNTIRVVRPLRDVTMKECSMFAWWNSIHVVGRDGRTRATAGIYGLTEDFIVGLEKDYPSTVSTIVRTCEKLEPKNASLNLCILCQRPIQEGLDGWENRISIRSYLDERLGSDLIYLPTSAPSSGSNISTTPDQLPSILMHLCYSCRTALTSRGSRTSKPTSSRILQSGLSPPSAPLPLWASTSCAQPRAQLMMMDDSGELWVRSLQDEAAQRNQIANLLLGR